MQRMFNCPDDLWQKFVNKAKLEKKDPGEKLCEIIAVYGSPLDFVFGAEEAAEEWPLSAGTIKNNCAEGKILAKKIGKTWVIDRTQTKPGKREEKD